MTDILQVLEQQALEGVVRATARHHEMEGKPYRPSSGMEGAAFQSHWCDLCARDAAFRNDPDAADGCPIVADTFAFDLGDPRYPKEWVYDAEGRPKCAAFTEDPACPVRCDRTMDMFTHSD